VKEMNLSTREARKLLTVARKPCFRSLDEGLHLGYRQSLNGGAWVVRWYSAMACTRPPILTVGPTTF
jgi:hypothetical protein